MSQQANSQVDTAAGRPSRGQKRAPRIDLAAGLVAKEKPAPKIDLAAGLIPRRENAKPGPGKSAVGGFVSGTRSASGSAPVAYSSLEGAGQPGNQRAQAKPAPTPKSINPLHDVVRSAAAAIDDFAAVASEATQEPMHVLAVDGAPQGTWQPGAPAAEAVLAVEAAETAPSESARQNERVEQANQQPAQEPSQPRRGRDPQPAPAPPVAYVPSRREPAPAPPAPPLEPAARQREARQPESTFVEPTSLQPAEVQYNAATRMTGLRNLIQTLGMKAPPQPPEAVEPVAQAARPPEPVQPRPVYPRTPPPVPHAPVRRNEPSASPTLVTAPPEFLPPRPMVEKEEKEHPSTHASTRRDRRDTYDDVEVLPSWRGQYKRK